MVLGLNMETILAILSAIPFQSSFRSLLSCGTTGFYLRLNLDEVRRSFIVCILISNDIKNYC